MPKKGRPRGWSAATESTQESALDEDTKRQLLEAAPDDPNYNDDVYAKVTTSSRKRSASSDMSESSTSSSLGDAKDSEDNNTRASEFKPPPTKRARVGAAGGMPGQNMAPRRGLSKWAARLFDPDRPRGLVEAPQVIPLNDEFLIAFGQREKAFDQAKGVQLPIDQDIPDDDDDSLYGDTPGVLNSTVGEGDDTQEGGIDDNKTVRIYNLKYTTQKSDLMSACSVFGAIVRIDLPIDESQTTDKLVINQGRATVVFDTDDGAKACADGLTELDGRPLKVFVHSPAGSNANRGRSSLGGSAPSRYYVKDISTKCYRCGEVGHREADCTNPPRAKPCPICAGIDHDLRACPIKAVCFNCGVPGHVARDCTRPRGMPPLKICTVCYQTGHSKMECRQSYREAVALSQDAICMICGERGHYLCKQLKWFFGVEGVSCSNCGQARHIGQECRRPQLEQLGRDEQMARREVERVLEEEEEMVRGRQREQQRRRAQSVPPRAGQRRSNGGSQYQPRDPSMARR